ncbi:hypothetical protein BG000_008224 [Podila horticola]|nr:hypothetical protein BG000_008224 [Podila horticola]
MSTWDIPDTSGGPGVESLKDEIAIYKMKAEESRTTMAALLRDVYSVDTQFIFTQDKNCSEYALWAHCSILSKYQAFDELIKKAIQETPDKDLERGPLTVVVEKVSFATFCTLLMFIYTGEVERNIDLSRFAIRKVDNPPKYTRIYDSKGDIARRHSLDLDSFKNFQVVLWEDLLFAADLYRINELRALSQEHVIGAIESNKAGETLIRVGHQFPEVKEASLNHIAKNMKTMFANGNDPFAPYVDHSKCHELLVEDEEQLFKLDFELCAFVIVAEVSNGDFSCKIDTTESDYLILSQFKQCSIGPVKGDVPFTTLLLYRYFREYEIGIIT